MGMASLMNTTRLLHDGWQWDSLGRPEVSEPCLAGRGPPTVHYSLPQHSLPAYVFRSSLSPSTRQTVFSSRETSSGLCRLQDLILIKEGEALGPEVLTLPHHGASISIGKRGLARVRISGVPLPSNTRQGRDLMTT